MLLHALDVRRSAYPMMVPEVANELYTTMEHSLRGDGDRLLDRVVSLLPTDIGPVTKRLDIGSPAEVIANVAQERKTDLIVMGARGVGPVQEQLFGSVSHRIVTLDSGQLDESVWAARQDSVQDLPEETLVFPLGSRYCETDLLSETALQLFGQTAPGYALVQAICDYVHNHIAFNYQNARATRSAPEVFNERTGVCRDYAHLAIAFCRCMNIPARYCTGT